MGTFKEHIFLVFTGADYNRLYNYKITKFTVFIRGGGKGGSGCGGAGCVLRLGFKSSKEKEEERAIKIEQMRIRGCAFHVEEVFHLVEIRSVFCLFFHSVLEFFLLNFAALIQVSIETF